MTQIDERERDGRMCDDYFPYVHKPCGRKIWVLIGFWPICPKCQPEEWAERKKSESR